MMDCSKASTNLLLSAAASSGWVARAGRVKIPETIPYPIRRNWSISIKYPPPAQTELVLRDGFRQS